MLFPFIFSCILLFVLVTLVYFYLKSKYYGELEIIISGVIATFFFALSHLLWVEHLRGDVRNEANLNERSIYIVTWACQSDDNVSNFFVQLYDGRSTRIYELSQLPPKVFRHQNDGEKRFISLTDDEIKNLSPNLLSSASNK